MSNEQIGEIFTALKKNTLAEDYHGENKIIQTENVIFQISTLEDQKNSNNPNVSTIDLGKCENILKNQYNISDKDSLIVVKTDIKNNDLSSTYVQYEIYDPNTLKQLNLKYCNDVKITVSVPVNLNDNTISLYDSLSESGYNLFDSEDDFYTDICSTYTSENGTDLTLADRKSEIYSVAENISLCQTGCEFESYNKTTKKAKCNCDAQTNNTETDINKIDFSSSSLAGSFISTLTNSNFLVLKCYKLALSLKNILENKGRITMTIIYILFIISLLIYIIKDRKRINLFINDILKGKANFNKNEKISNIYNNNKKKTSKNKEAKDIFKISPKIKKLVKKKSNEPPKKRKSKKVKKTNFEDFNPLTKTTFTNSNLKAKNNRININIIPINNINYGKYKKKRSKSIKSVAIYNNKPKNNLSNDIDYKNLNDQELNNLEYNLAILIDKRTYFQYYWSLLKKKQLILFTILPANDYNLFSLKLALFLLSFSLYFTINGFFFSDETMHKINEDKGAFNFIFQIPQILYSSVVSAVINMILKMLSLSEKNILALKQEKDINIATQKSKNIEKCITIKFIIFFLLSNLLLLFFWYFISCFCAVYTNTQMILIKDTLLSFGLSMTYPFGLNLLPGMFRIPALRAEKKDKNTLYKISLLVALI